MKAVVIALMLLSVGFVAVAAAPTASACVVDLNDPVGDVVVCANRGIDSAQCIATGHCP